MKHDLLEKLEVKAGTGSRMLAEQAVLIIGHPLTDYRGVETVLHGVAMAPAQATRQQRLEASDISAHLLKRAGVVADFSVKIEQIAPSPIWQILALDLFMGNSEAGFWGWSDPHCIYLLDYWYATDPAMHFVFVYDSLEQVLLRASAQGALSRDALNQLSNEWESFYSTLLHFYHRHRERCLLVHAEQACGNPEAFDRALSSLLQRPLERKAYAPCALPAGDLQAFLSAGLAQEQYAWRCAYEDLQSQADLPLAKDTASSALSAWNDFSALTAQIRREGEALAATTAQIAQASSQLEIVQGQRAQLEARLDERQKEGELLTLQLQQVQEELDRHFIENGSLKQGLAKSRAGLETQLRELQRQLDETRATAKKAQTERDTKIAELEQLCLENGTLKQSLAQSKIALETQRVQLQGQLDETRASAKKAQSDRDTEARELLEAKDKAEKRITSLEQRPPQNVLQAAQKEKELLLLQLHQVQEELERFYLESQQPAPSQLAPTQPKQAAPKRPAPPSGAAARVKRQLSYRLGAAMIGQSKSFSGWVGMPGAVVRAVREYHHDKQLRSGEKLPPLSSYADAQEGERIKRHLSYRLGATVLANYQSPIGLIKLPWLMRKQVFEFRRERASKHT